MRVDVAVEGKPAAVIRMVAHDAVWVEYTARTPAADYRSPPEPLLTSADLLDALDGIADRLDLPDTWARTVPVHHGRPPVSFDPPSSDFLADCLRAALLTVQ